MKTWIKKLQSNYASFTEWESYSQTYGLAKRLGFENEQAAWAANPLIGGSTKPDDFGLVTLAEEAAVIRSKTQNEQRTL